MTSRSRSVGGPLAAWAPLWHTPLAGKDLGPLGRTRFLLGLIFLPLGVGGLLLCGSGSGQDLEALSTWMTYRPTGRIMLLTLVGTGLFVQAIGMPLAGATAIALERERGTWAPLITTSLTPGQIVLGKYAAVLGLALPAHLALLPALAAVGFWGDVGPGAVLLAALVLVLHGGTQAALGLLASALSQHVRRAVTLSLLMALALFGGPVLLSNTVVFISWESGQLDAAALIPYGVILAWLAVVLTWACLSGARSAIAPAAVPRFSLRRPLRAFTLSGGPVLAAVGVGLAGHGRTMSVDEVELLTLLLSPAAAAVLSLSVILEVASAPGAGEARPGPTPRRAALETCLWLVGGLAIAVPLLSLSLDGAARAPLVLTPRWWSAGELFGHLMAWGALFAAYFVGLAGGTALLARWLRRPWHRALLALLLGLGLMLTPFFGLTVSELLGGREWLPLFWMNPFGMAADLSLHEAWMRSSLDPVTLLGVPGWLAGALAWALLGAVGLGLRLPERVPG